MKETRPLLTSSGKDYQEKDGFCTKRNIIIIIAIFLILLTIGLLVGFLVDWTDDDEPVGETGNNRYWQEQFQLLPSNESTKQISVDLGSKPHVAGKPEQIWTGEYVQDFFENLNGFDVVIQEWDDTVLDHFVSSSLKWSLNVSEGFEELDIAEEILPNDIDPDTNTTYASHIWNAYSASNTVQGNIVYINWGRRSDYEDIIADENYPQITGPEYFQGKIGLVRYGGMGRSTKVKVAQDYEMVGLLMFSDPNQYAPEQNLTYPDGPWLPETGVQRGSIKYASCPGNPTEDRLDRICGITDIDEALPTIPVMPLSYKNAEIIFGVMRSDGGVIPPESWQESAYEGGDINIGYTLDASTDFVIELEVTTDLRTEDVTMNVYGIIYGDEYEDEVVMIGAHRDAWVCGVQDDVSGTATIMEVARGFGDLYRRGWRPKRTMVFASWDSEESGLIGSTNFGEEVVAQNITGGPIGDVNLDGIIAYVNLDMTTGDDIFGVQGNPLLGGVSFEAMRETKILNNRGEFADYETFMDAFETQNGTWGKLGAGSDHTVFAFYMGVAAMDTGFGGPRSWGAYHSMYDTIGWQETVDPNWMLAEDIARYTGVLTMKLLDSTVIPFDLEIFASVIREWFTDDSANGLMGAMDTYNCYPNDVFPDQNITDETLEIIDAFVDVAMDLNDAITELRNRTNAGEDADTNEDGLDDDEMVSIVNEFLGGLSKVFTTDEGLPDRIWYKNMLWDPAPEDGPINVFPYIWHALETGCDTDTLQTAFSVTQGLFNDAISSMQGILSNVTQS